MPAELDALELKISANSSNAASNIDRLIGSLEKLDKALSFSNFDKYSSSMSNLSMGMLDLAQTVNNIDSKNLKGVASAINALASSASKLSGLQSAGEAVNQVFSEGINTSKSREEISNEIAELELVQQTARETRDTLRDMISRENLAIPKDIWKEYPDDAKSLRATIGVGNTSNQGYDYTEFIKNSIKQSGAGNIDDVYTQTEAFVELARILRDLGTQIENAERKLPGLYQQLDYVSEHAQEAASSLADMVDGDSFMTIPDNIDVSGDDWEEQLFSSMGNVEQVVPAVQNIASAVESISPAPLTGLVEALQQLEGINIPDMTNLSNLAASIGKLGGSYAGSAAMALPQIAEGLQTLSNVSIPNMEGIDVLAQNLSRLGYKSVGNAANNLPFIAQGLSQLGNIQIPNIEGLDALGASLARFGYKSATAAVENIPKLGVAFNQLISTLSHAPAVSQNVIDLANALANLASQGGRAGAAVSAVSPRLNSFAGNAKRATKATFSFAAAVGKIYASYWLLFRVFSKLGSSINLASSLVETQNVVDTVFGDASDKVETFADNAMMSFGMTELTAKQFSSRFQAMGSAMGITNQQVASASEYLTGKLSGLQNAYKDLGGEMADVSINLTKLAADMGSFYNLEYDEVAEDLESIFTGMTRPLRAYGLDLTQATLKEYALRNGLNADIESMTQAEKTMLRYQYVMDRMGRVMGDFTKTADTWANVTRTIGQQFQKLGSLIGTGLINAFRPALIRVRDFLNTLIDLVEKGLNAIGKLLGWQIEISDVGLTMDDDMSDYADSVGDAAGNAKKLKDYLLGIDELNVLSPDDGSGSGGGGGATGGGGGSENRATSADVTFKEYESAIETWFDLGQAVRDTIVDGLNSIDWDSIQSRVSENAKHFAEFLNGLFSPDENNIYVLGDAIGRFLAEALNTGVDWFYTFATTFKWEDLGMTIATAINTFFATFDFGQLANTIDAWVQGIWDLIKTTITNIDWGKVWDGVTDFLSEIDVKTVSILIGGFALKYLGKILTSGILKDAIAGKIATLAKSAGLSSSLVAGSALIFGVELAITGVIVAREVSEWIDDIRDLGWNAGREKYRKDNDEANPYTNHRAVVQENGSGSLQLWQKKNRQIRLEEKQEFSDWVAEIGKKWDELKERVVTNANDMSDDIGSSMSDISKWFTAEKWEELGENIKSGLQTKWGEFTSWWEGTGIPGWWNDNVAPWFTLEKWSELGQGIKDGLSQKWTEFKEFWVTDLPLWWETNVVPWFTLERWLQLADSIKTSIKTKWDETVGQWAIDIQAWWDEKVAPWFTFERWTQLVDTIKTSIKSKWDETVSQWWTDINSWWSEKVAPWFTANRWKELLSNIAPKFKEAFKEAANNAIGALNSAIGGIESMVNSAIDALNSLIDLAQKVPGVDSIISNVGHISLPRIPTYANGGFIPSTSYSIFAAGEGGIPEMLGTVGGRNAVAGGAEITGIRSAVEASSEREALLMQRLIEVEETLISVVESKELSIGDRDIAMANTRGQRMLGYQLRTS